jgi:hypothetical protein
MEKILLSLLIVFVSCCAFAQVSVDASGSFASYSRDDVKISIYPNPASDYVNVQDRDNSVGSVNIFNLAGRKIKSFAIEGSQMLSIIDLPKGMYLIQFVDKKDKLITTQRLSKK